MRVLHCPTTVGGNPQGLARAERELGLQSWSVTVEQNYFKYPVDEVLCSQKGIRCELKRWQLLWRAARHFDVIHYNFGSSIFPNYNGNAPKDWIRVLYHRYSRFMELRDVQWLKQLGKKIVVTYQGDDARQGDFGLANVPGFPSDGWDKDNFAPWFNDAKRSRIKRFDRLADHIFALNPDLLRVLPARARFMPYAHIDLREWLPVYKNATETPVLVHAPSHRGIKGTSYVLAAVERLKAEGVAFEFRVVEKMSNQEAREVYETADLLLDQLRIGWYGGLAVELMALGKPVICYIRQDDLRFVPAAMASGLPIIQADTNSIYSVLHYWLTEGRSQLMSKGIQSRQYVERWHDPLKIAAQLKEVYAH